MAALLVRAMPGEGFSAGAFASTEHVYYCFIPTGTGMISRPGLHERLR